MVAQHFIADVVSKGPDHIAVEFGQFYYYFAALLVIRVMFVYATYFEYLYFLFCVEMDLLLSLMEISVLIEQFHGSHTDSYPLAFFGVELKFEYKCRFHRQFGYGTPPQFLPKKLVIIRQNTFALPRT